MLQDLTIGNVLLFAAFVVPGFISMQVYSLKHPVETTRLKDNILEAIAFGLVNAALMSWAIKLLVDPDFTKNNSLSFYILMVLVVVIAPMVWPLLLHWLLSILEEKGFILKRCQTSWDDFFLRKKSCWIIVHFKDGRRIGGWYGENSYAGLYPNSGYLYLEELWTLDNDGKFVGQVSGSQGIILRPDDYHSIELFKAHGEDNDQP